MRILLLSFGLIFLSSKALSAPITFTGAELAALPGGSFPTGTQSIIGDSLRFNPTASDVVLYRLDLNSFALDPNNINISVNVDRLLDDAGSADQDIRIGIYDGQNFFNTTFIDLSSPQSIRPENQVDTVNASVTQLTSNLLRDIGPFIPSAIGSVAQLDVTIRATPTSTTIIGEVNQGGGFATTTSRVLDVNANLSLLIVNQTFRENHIINSLSLSSGPTAVVEPASLGITGLGLLGFGLFRRRLLNSSPA